MREVAIPHIYIEFAEKSSAKRKTYLSFIRGYISSNYPGWKLQDIKGKKAIIEKT
ncbi:hypothetical protein [Salimicrobium jeotgali]|uniref:hypothetical protein n=1 Tax=Salimicrobium jeotgali TaxID=1230341 RepID=UPI0015E0825C|nr:hypothetical protein [Salimicrobium jeotgali]